MTQTSDNRPRHFALVNSGYDVMQVNLFVEEVKQRFALAKEHLNTFHRDNERLRRENENLTRMVTNLAVAGEEMIEASRREAETIIAAAQTEAAERVAVARADARSLVAEERIKVVQELEMLAIVRQTIVRERDSLLEFHSELSGRLRGVVEAIINYNDDSRVDELGAIGQLIPSALMPGPPREPSLDDDSIETFLTVADVRDQDVDDGDDDVFAPDADEEAALDAFFSGAVEAEPSREWMLNES